MIRPTFRIRKDMLAARIDGWIFIRIMFSETLEKLERIINFLRFGNHFNVCRIIKQVNNFNIMLLTDG